MMRKANRCLHEPNNYLGRIERGTINVPRFFIILMVFSGEHDIQIKRAGLPGELAGPHGRLA